ncbi:MAG: TetR/AcrR family transcriptional regulator [Deltaproteobacteria bacterium]|nr:TetR/AcrR family transcriptional regulator [Deltaproteobacteria bacterium]
MSVRRDGQERRDALLDAALRCFSRSGVLGTGIEAIRKEAGASPSSVYHQFSDVRALTLALLVRTCERLFAAIAQGVAAEDGAEALVRRLVGAHVDWVLGHPEEARFMYQALALELSPEAAATLQARKAELLAPIIVRFVPYIEEGTLPAWPPLVFDVVLVGPAHEACRRWLAGAALDPAWMRAELPRLAWRAVAPERRRGR